MVWQNAQRAGLDVQSGRSVRFMAECPGLRIFLWLPRRRLRSMASGFVREYQADRALFWKSQLHPRPRSGGQGDRLDADAACARAQQALVPVLRDRYGARTASRAEGMDSEVQRSV